MIDAGIIAREVKALPTLPVGVARLARLCGDPRTSVKELEDVIHPDLALTANLLRVANSALFRGRVEVAGVREAVVRLGVRQVLGVAASAHFRRVIPERLAGYEIEAHAFWVHGVAVATLAERLRRHLGGGGTDHAFTAGLLHDVGKLVISDHLAGSGERVRLGLTTTTAAFVELEREVLGVDHCEVGHAVARAWGLPAAVADAARWHHDPDRAPPESREIATLIHVADALAHSAGWGADMGGLHRRVDAAALARRPFDVRLLEQVLAGSVDDVNALSEILAAGGRS